MGIGKGRKKRGRSRRRSLPRHLGSVKIPIALVDGSVPSGSIEFTDVPEGIQRKVEEILREKGLIPQSR